MYFLVIDVDYVFCKEVDMECIIFSYIIFILFGESLDIVIFLEKGKVVKLDFKMVLDFRYVLNVDVIEY